MVNLSDNPALAERLDFLDYLRFRWWEFLIVAVLALFLLAVTLPFLRRPKG